MVSEVHLATNRISIELTHADHLSEPVEIEIEYLNGWLVAGVRANGWLEKSDEELRRAFCACLAGLYKRADVDLVREQLLEALPSPVASFQLTYEGLLVWADAETPPLLHELRDGLDDPALAPRFNGSYSRGCRSSGAIGSNAGRKTRMVMECTDCRCWVSP